MNKKIVYVRTYYSMTTKSGILYVLHIELEGKSLVKIGMTTRNIEDRVSEILISIFKKYREFPYCRPHRFTKVTDVMSKEKEMHKKFSSHKFKTSKRFSGSTEFFEVPVDSVVKVYDKLYKPKARPKTKKKGVFFSTVKP